MKTAGLLLALGWIAMSMIRYTQGRIDLAQYNLLGAIAVAVLYMAFIKEKKA